MASCTRLLIARLLATALATATGAAPASVPAASPPDGPTTFNLGLSSAAGLRVEWRPAAFAAGRSVGGHVNGKNDEDSDLPEPASASLALASLAVLGALIAQRRLDA